MKGTFNQNSQGRFSTTNRSEIVTLVGEMRDKLSRLSSNEARLGHFYIGCCRSEYRGRLLALRIDRKLFLGIVSIRRPDCWYITGLLVSWSTVDQTKHIYERDGWRSSLRDCRSYLSIPLNSNSVLVCTKLFVSSDVSLKSMRQRRWGNDKLSPVQLAYQFSGALEFPPPNNRWSQSLIKNILHPAGLVSCSLSRRVMTSWISAETLRPLDVPQSIPAGGEYSEARLITKSGVNVSLRRDRDI